MGKRLLCDASRRKCWTSWRATNPSDIVAALAHALGSVGRDGDRGPGWQLTGPLHSTVPSSMSTSRWTGAAGITLRVSQIGTPRK